MTARRHGGVGLAIDLENICWTPPATPGGEPWPGAERIGWIIARVRYLAGPADQVLAVGHPSLVARLVGLPAASGLVLRTTGTGPGPDAADAILIEWARFLIERGFDRMAVASGDHAFTELAAAVPTLVIARDPESVSADLARSGFGLAFIDEPPNRAGADQTRPPCRVKGTPVPAPAVAGCRRVLASPANVSHRTGVHR